MYEIATQLVQLNGAVTEDNKRLKRELADLKSKARELKIQLKEAEEADRLTQEDYDKVFDPFVDEIGTLRVSLYRGCGWLDYKQPGWNDSGLVDFEAIRWKTGN